LRREGQVEVAQGGEEKKTEKKRKEAREIQRNVVEKGAATGQTSSNF